MKVYKLFFIFISFLGSCSSDDPINGDSWKEINSMTSNNLTDVEFLNENFGVVCGDLGTLLKTEDGGQNWEKLNVGVNDSFFKVFILSESNFFTSRLGIYKTNNGGETFLELGESSSFGSSIFDLHFFDENKGIINKSGTLYKTYDGGNSWNNVYDQFGFADKLKFPSNEVGYLAGGNNFDNVNFGELHKTVDGGENWSEIELPSKIRSANITSIYFLTESLGYLANVNNDLYLTQDGGLSWDLKSNNLLESFVDMAFINQQVGYSIGGSSVFKTENGGVDWVEDFSNSQIALLSIAKVPNGIFFVVGNNGKILTKK